MAKSEEMVPRDPSTDFVDGENEEENQRNQYDHTGTLEFMATELLWDEHGNLFLTHHITTLNLFFWVIVWCIYNLTGPYFALRSWPQDGSEVVAQTALLKPPCWLIPGQQTIPYADIVCDRSACRGQFQTQMAPLFHSFWSDPAIKTGVEELFDIFLPLELALPDEPEVEFGCPRIKLPHDPPCTHDRMITILQRIVDQVGDDPMLSPDEVSNARSRFFTGFRTTLH